MSNASALFIARDPDNTDEDKIDVSVLHTSALMEDAAEGTDGATCDAVKVAASTTDNHVFFEMNDGLPTKQEVLVTAVVLASSSNACDDNEMLNSWVTATTTLSGISGFSPSVLSTWQPPKEYMMGKACTHSLMATGKDWLKERKTETTKAICVALTQQGIVVSRSSLSWYLWRLREPAKSQHTLRTNGRPRLYYVLTWAALFLRRADNVPKIIALLRAAHDSLPLRPLPSPTKALLYGIAHRQLDATEKRSAEIEALKKAHSLEKERMQEAFRAEIAEKEEKIRRQERRILDRDKKTKRRQERRSEHLSRLEEKVKERAQEQVARRVERDAQRHQRRMSETTLEKVELLDRATELHKRIDELELAAFEKSEEFAEVEQELMDRIRRLESQVKGIKDFKYVPSKSSGGLSIPMWMRLMVYELCVYGTPTSSMEDIIRCILRHCAPSIVVKMPGARMLRVLREEVSLLTDCMSALLLARADRIKQLGHDGSDVNQVAVLASNMLAHIPGEGDVEIMLRACFITQGKTSELELDSIKEQFSRLEHLLADWNAELNIMFPENEIKLPPSEGCTIAKLAGGNIMSDNAPAATKTSNLVAEHIYNEIEKELAQGFDENDDLDVDRLPEYLKKLMDARGLDPAVVAEMSDEELRDALNIILSTCHRHTYNILIGHGEKAELEYLKVLLGPSLEEFSDFDRVTADVSGLNRASGKEFDFRSQAAYPKGDAIVYFLHWLLNNYPERMVLNSFRAMVGGRQDHALRAAAELWWNRPLFVEFLEARSAQEPMRSKLRDAVAVSLRSLEIIGAIMGRTVILDKLIEPIGFFSSSEALRKEQDWTSLNMATAYEKMVGACELAKEDGAFLMTLNLDVFEGVGGPPYENYKVFLVNEMKACPNGVAKKWREDFRNELYNPQDPTNIAALPFARRIVEVWCASFVKSSKITAVKDYLHGGKFGLDQQTPEIRAQLQGTHRNNDALGESVFGLLKEIIRDTRGLPVPVAAGLASARKQRVFDMGVKHQAILQRKRRGSGAAAAVEEEQVVRRSPFSIFGLAPELVESLVSMIRKRRRHYMRTDVDTLVKQRELAHERGEKAAAALVKKVVKNMENQWSLFFNVERDADPAVIDASIESLLLESRANARILTKNKENKAIDYVRRQLRIYTEVFQLPQFKISKGGSSLQALRDKLITELGKLPPGGLPDGPVCKALSSNTLKALGTLTPQAVSQSRARSSRMEDAHRDARAQALAAKEVKAKAVAALHERRRQRRLPTRRAPRLRESKAGNKVPCPAIDDELVGKAIEMGFQVERDLILDQDAWVGSHVEKDFNGVMYCGIVTSFEDGLFHVEYDDGDEEDMDRGDLGQLLQTQVDRINTFSSVSYCYGEIRGVKIAKQKRGAKTVSHALLYVRWDPRLFPVEDNDSLEWVNVIPRNYGAVGKDSWELVEVRTPDDGPAAVLSSESDGDSEMEAETELPSWEEDSEGEDERDSESESDVSEDDDSEDSDFGRPTKSARRGRGTA